MKKLKNIFLENEFFNKMESQASEVSRKAAKRDFFKNSRQVRQSHRKSFSLFGALGRC